MPAGSDPAAVFLRLLECCAITHRLVLRSGLQTIQRASRPLNPLDIAVGSDRPLLRLAMKQGFDRVLRSGLVLDWDRIKTGVTRIEENLAEQELAEQELAEQENDRIVAILETRWIALAENNPYFDFRRWSDSWSRRHLEGVLGFFAEDAVYFDTTRNYGAEGKRELRALFSRLFHASEGATVIHAAKFVPADGEIELEWILTGSRIPGPDMGVALGSGTVRGKSNLWVDGGRILMCIDCPSEEDLNRIAMTSLDFSGQSGVGAIRETPAMVCLDRIVLLKPLKFKKRPMTQDDAK